MKQKLSIRELVNKARYPDGGLIKSNQPTKQDSLDVMQSALESKDFYDRFKKFYKEPKINVFNNIYKQDVESGKTEKETLDNPDTTNKQASKIKNNKNKNVHYINDLITGALDPNAPMIRYDSRIKPQGQIEYRVKDSIGIENPMDIPLGYNTIIPHYDPLAVKPYSMLTESEKALRLKKYGPTGFPNTATKKSTNSSTSTPTSIPIPPRPKPEINTLESKGINLPSNEESLSLPNNELLKYKQQYRVNPGTNSGFDANGNPLVKEYNLGNNQGWIQGSPPEDTDTTNYEEIKAHGGYTNNTMKYKNFKKKFEEGGSNEGASAGQIAAITGGVGTVLGDINEISDSKVEYDANGIPIKQNVKWGANIAKSTLSGAGVGASFGGVGAAVGAGVGALWGVGKSLIQGNRNSNQYDDAMSKMQAANVTNGSNYVNTNLQAAHGGNITNNSLTLQNNMYNKYKSRYAQGGTVDELGVNFISEKAGLHHQSSKGGVPIGPDALAEGGEAKIQMADGGQYIVSGEVDGANTQSIDGQTMTQMLKKDLKKYMMGGLANNSQDKEDLKRPYGNTYSKATIDQIKNKAVQYTEAVKMRTGGALQYAAHGGKLTKDIEKIVMEEYAAAYGGMLPNKYKGKVNMPGSYAKGGIHIDESKKGTFTAAATKHGKSVQEFARQVLANKDNYSSGMVKKANFAHNAAGWKHAYGGPIDRTAIPGDPASRFNYTPSGDMYPDGGMMPQDQQMMQEQQMQQASQEQMQQQGGQDQMMQMVQQVEEAIMQGANPEQVMQQVMQELVQSGTPEEQAMQQAQQVVQMAMQDLQSQQGQGQQQQMAPPEQMMAARGGKMYYEGGPDDPPYKNSNTIPMESAGYNDYNPYSKYGYPLTKKQKDRLNTVKNNMRQSLNVNENYEDSDNPLTNYYNTQMNLLHDPRYTLFGSANEIPSSNLPGPYNPRTLGVSQTPYNPNLGPLASNENPNQNLESLETDYTGKQFDPSNQVYQPDPIIFENKSNGERKQYSERPGAPISPTFNAKTDPNARKSISNNDILSGVGIASGLVGPMAHLLNNKKPKPFNYKLGQANTLNPATAIALANQASREAQTTADYGIKTNAPTSGSFLANLRANALQSGLGRGRTAAGITQQYDIGNADILNRFEELNTGITNKGIDERRADLGNWRTQKTNAAYNLGANLQGSVRDIKANKIDEIIANNIGTTNYKYDPVGQTITYLAANGQTVTVPASTIVGTNATNLGTGQMQSPNAPQFQSSFNTKLNQRFTDRFKGINSGK